MASGEGGGVDRIMLKLGTLSDHTFSAVYRKVYKLLISMSQDNRWIRSRPGADGGSREANPVMTTPPLHVVADLGEKV